MPLPPLTPDKSPLSHDKWEPFIQDEETQSYSYYLPHKDDDDAVFATREQLDRWFRELHPNSFVANEDMDDVAWTDAHYQGELLLRKTAWCVLENNDEDVESSCQCEYGYSDTWQSILRSEKMKRTLMEITSAVSRVCGLTTRKTGEECQSEQLNSCNLNYYPRGGGVGFHADDEFLFDGLHRPVRIISLSLASPFPNTHHTDKKNVNYDENTHEEERCWGARKFQVRRKDPPPPAQDDEENVHEILLRHGDIMTMEGYCQKYYLHSVWPGDRKDLTDHPLTQGERINLTWRTIVRHLDGSEECKGKVCPLHIATTSPDQN
mmetsp:Transcript_15927/g.28959  ORF Transcript_15927/g.28959 Transcript_15927/m.28959 type:complete len:321 (-) Transcript_15927:245-1207(-)